MRLTSSKWFIPVMALAFGVIALGALWIGGDAVGGLISLAIMAAVAAAIRFGGRSETVRGLRGDGRDERFRQIDLCATALAGVAVLAATIIASVVEWAHGRSGAPYTWLGAIGGLSYVLGVLVLRVRG